MQFGIQKIPAEERGHVLRRKIKLVMKEVIQFSCCLTDFCWLIKITPFNASDLTQRSTTVHDSSVLLYCFVLYFIVQMLSV